jgi:hypothetical protein
MRPALTSFIVVAQLYALSQQLAIECLPGLCREWCDVNQGRKQSVRGHPRSMTNRPDRREGRHNSAAPARIIREAQLIAYAATHRDEIEQLVGRERNADHSDDDDVAEELALLEYVRSSPTMRLRRRTAGHSDEAGGRMAQASERAGRIGSAGGEDGCRQAAG